MTLPTIVIFGAAVFPGGRPSPTLERRVRAAFAFGGTAARYMPTGGIGRHGPSEARVMAALLRTLGVPADRIELEETGTDTLSSALACAALLRGRAGVFAASSGYHVPRCRMLLRLAGVPAGACPPGPEPFALYWVLRECAGLPWDWLVMHARTFRFRS